MSHLTPVLPPQRMAGRSVELWWAAVCADRRLGLRLDQLLTAKALAELADKDGCLKVSMRDLAEAVSRKDAVNRTRATVERGLRGLTRRGYVVRLNPGAPRAERGHYRLAVPADALEGLVAGLVAAENAA
jgi:hypothetical protein